MFIETVSRAIDPHAWNWLDQTDSSHIAWQPVYESRMQTALRAVEVFDTNHNRIDEPQSALVKLGFDLFGDNNG